MPGAKSGTPVNSVSAAKPDAVHQADSADPGQVSKAKAEQLTQKTGKYGQTKAPAFQPPPIAVSSKDKAAQDKQKQIQETWVGISLVDEAGKPLAGQPYRITLPDGSVARGTTDASGKARVDQFEPGNCTLQLDELDEKAW